jgi:hypothetical protein
VLTGYGLLLSTAAIAPRRVAARLLLVLSIAANAHQLTVLYTRAMHRNSDFAPY